MKTWSTNMEGKHSKKKQILFLPNKYNFYTLDRVETEHFAAFYVPHLLPLDGECTRGWRQQIWKDHEEKNKYPCSNDTFS